MGPNVYEMGKKRNTMASRGDYGVVGRKSFRGSCPTQMPFGGEGAIWTPERPRSTSSTITGHDQDHHRYYVLSLVWSSST